MSGVDDGQLVEVMVVLDQSLDRDSNAVEPILKEAILNPELVGFGGVFAAGQRALRKSDAEMSAIFKVSQPTISRWSRGVTAPHPLARKTVFETLLREFRKLQSQ